MHLSISRGAEVTGVCTMESRCFPSLGILQVIAASVWMVFTFPWEESDFCNEIRWLDGIFWHSVCVLANLF